MLRYIEVVMLQKLLNTFATNDPCEILLDVQKLIIRK